MGHTFVRKMYNESMATNYFIATIEHYCILKVGIYELRLEIEYFVLFFVIFITRNATVTFYESLLRF